MFHVEHFVDKLFPGNSAFVDKIKNLLVLEQEYFKWNSKINISSIRDQRGFWEKHILDSLCLLKYLVDDIKIESKKDTYIYDIGCGGGFPGIVLSFFTERKITLVDPVNKKADYVEHIARKFSLTNVIVERKKYEEILFQDNSIIVSRALGRYEELYQHLKSQDKKFEMVLMITNKTIPEIPGKVIKYPYEILENNGIPSLSDHILFHV